MKSVRAGTAPETYPPRQAPIPLPENIRGVQPGGGRCYEIELAWGRVRRWLLRRLRPGYVRRMADLREGDASTAPHEVLDPRDLKYCCNVCSARWKPSDDPFRWRERLPLVRWGLAEVQLMGWPLAALTVGVALLGAPWGWLAVAPAALTALVVSFFRDPRRTSPREAGCFVAPADGKVVEISELEHDEFIDGPAVRIGIFLSLFNVHINRLPEYARVLELRYHPGEFLSATKPESALRNESMWIGLETEDAPHRRFVVRQISGLIARRIVCTLLPGEVGERGHKFGMIKLGSRTELILPADGLTVRSKIGDRVRAGSTVMARYADG